MLQIFAIGDLLVYGLTLASSCWPIPCSNTYTSSMHIIVKRLFAFLIMCTFRLENSRDGPKAAKSNWACTHKTNGAWKKSKPYKKHISDSQERDVKKLTNLETILVGMIWQKAQSSHGHRGRKGHVSSGLFEQVLSWFSDLDKQAEKRISNHEKEMMQREHRFTRKKWGKEDRGEGGTIIANLKNESTPHVSKSFSQRFVA